jgi:RNA polymerase sigma-32 factor
MHRRLSGPDRSLDSLLHPDDVGNWEPSLVSVNDPENAIGERDEIAVRKTALPMALSTLNERQRHILVERRLKETPAKLEELAAHYRVSAERVRQIEVHALEKLRHSMRQQMSPPVEARARLDCARNGRRVVS